MAKQAVSWVELHIEKFVLGVTGALLAATVGLYGVSTPNTKSVVGVEAGPTRLDSVIVRGQAEYLRESLQRQPPDIQDVPDYAGQWRKVQEDVLAAAGVFAPVLSARPWGQIVPLLDSLSLPEKKTTGLAEVLPPGKPGFASGRSTIYTAEYVQGELRVLGEGAAEGQSGQRPPSVAFEDLSWITVGAVIDLAAQRAAFFDAGYDARYTDVHVYDVQAQRQTRLPDGRWSDWEDIVPYYPYLHWGAPQLRFKRERSGELKLPSDQIKALNAFMGLVKEYQCELRLPGFALRSAGDKWEFPAIEGADWRTVAKQCEGYITVPASLLAGGQEEQQEEESKLRPQQRIKKWLKEVEVLASTAGERTYEELRDARKTLRQILKEPEAKASQTKKAQELLEIIEPFYYEAREKKRKEEFWQEVGEEDEEAPGAQVAETGPTQTVVWVHDLGLRPDGLLAGLEPGRTYRYRLRLRLLNTLAGQLDPEADSTAAEQVLLVGGWSPPSAPVVATKDKEFYVVSVDSAGQRAQVQVSVWREGERLNKRFTVGLGEEIGEDRVRCKVKETVENEVRDKTVFVDFRTGVTLLGIEPDRVYQRRKAKRDGFEFDPVRTEAVILADASGALEERLVYLERQSYAAMQKALEEETATAKKEQPEKEEEKDKKGGGGIGGQM